MPKLKQPPPLLKMATDLLIDFLAKYCNTCTIEGSLDKLRQVVAFIKSDIGSHIPWKLEADFYNRFLEKYVYGFRPREERPKTYERAVLEVVMDRKIIGLICSDVKSMNLNDAHRLIGLQELVLDDLRLYNLETFHFEDLKMLTYSDRCTDSDLGIIGKNCPKLEDLDVSGSEQVTDNGIRALDSCPELQDLYIRGCPKITHKGIQHVLSAHEKIQRLHAYRPRYSEVGFNCFSNAGWSVYPSITEFDVIRKKITNENLRVVAGKFPNLISLIISGNLDDSARLRTLGSMKRLSKLEFLSEYSFAWDDLKSLLRMIGANITTLKTRCFNSDVCCVTQTDLDFLYKFCPNIECFEFDYDAEADGEILIIPPFKSLKVLECLISPLYDQYYPQLQFGVMSKLERLVVHRVEMTTEIIESMMLDNVKFPNLEFIGMHEVYGHCDLDRIREIAKNNNLNFTVEDKIVVRLDKESYFVPNGAGS